MYAHQTESLCDVKEYLKTSLTPTDSAMPRNESGWIQTHGFRRGFCIHSVFKNGDNEYMFKVYDGDGDPVDMGTYNDWDAMILGVAVKYCNAWHIPVV